MVFAGSNDARRVQSGDGLQSSLERLKYVIGEEEKIMKRWITVAALVAAFGLASGVQAKEKKAKGSHAKITSIAPDANDKTLTDIVVTVGGKKNPQQVTVTANKDTVVTIDGKAAQLSDIAVGQRVTLSPSTGLVQSLAVTTHTHKKKNNDTTTAAPTTNPAAPSTQPAAAAN